MKSQTLNSPPVKARPANGPDVTRDLIAVLRTLEERGVTVTVTNCPPLGGFGVWIGDPDDPTARRIFRRNELDEIAGWLLATAEHLPNDPGAPQAL